MADPRSAELRTFLKTFVTYGGRKMDDLLRPIRRTRIRA